MIDTGHVDIVKFLIEKGAEVNTKGRNEWTPLHSSINMGNCLNFLFLTQISV